MNYNFWKIIIFIIILVIIVGCLPASEKFVNATGLVNNTITYKVGSTIHTLDKNYDRIKIDTLANKMVLAAKSDKLLVKKINDNMIDIFTEIQNNENIKDYLKSINLINNDGYPIFINENKDILLFNMIKIQLILLKKI
jgi:hypothetical protein